MDSAGSHGAARTAGAYTERERAEERVKKRREEGRRRVTKEGGREDSHHRRREAATRGRRAPEGLPTVRPEPRACIVPGRRLRRLEAARRGRAQSAQAHRS